MWRFARGSRRNTSSLTPAWLIGCIVTVGPFRNCSQAERRRSCWKQMSAMPGRIGLGRNFVAHRRLPVGGSTGR